MNKREFGEGWIAEYSGGVVSVKREFNGLLSGVWLQIKGVEDLRKFLNGDKSEDLVTDEIREFLSELGEERTMFLRFFLNEWANKRSTS